MVDSTFAWPQPEALLDNLEHRFKQYENSDNYNPRLIWDEECVKIVVGAKNPLLRAFGFFTCVCRMYYTYSHNILARIGSRSLLRICLPYNWSQRT